MSTIVQNIDFKTINKLIIRAVIQKINDSKYICDIHEDNANGNFCNLPLSQHSSAQKCFTELVKVITNVISAQYPDDTLEKIDNTCNCSHISKEEEEKIISTNSISILVNGEKDTDITNSIV